MTKQYRTREGEATAVDTKTQLTTLGSQAAPGPLLVPQGVSKLLGIWVAAAAFVAGVGRATGIVRLEGPGLPKGPEVIACGAHGYNMVTGSQELNGAKFVPLGIDVTPGNEILIFLEMCGVDVGQISGAVTLVFGA